jgi:hypothetical protein
MSAPKPHIKPKAAPFRQQTGPPDRDVPAYGGWDPPVFIERNADGEQKAEEAVLYYEDDCLR